MTSGCKGQFPNKPGTHTRLKLNLAGRERLILHDNCAAAGQDHDVQLLLLLVGLLVPFPHDLSVMCRNQCHLKWNKRMKLIYSYLGRCIKGLVKISLDLFIY